MIFWKMLKRGYDHFEITRIPPKVDVCGKRYEFNTKSDSRYPSLGLCPERNMPLSLASAFVKQQNSYATRFEELLAKAEGRKPGALQPLTITTALPGVNVAMPAPAVVIAKPETPAVTSTVEQSKVETPAATIPPSQSGDLETVIKPAG